MRLALATAVLCLGLHAPVLRAAPASVYLQELSSTEVRDGARAGSDDHHHPGGRGRAERRAHGAGQAQLPRAACWPGASPPSWAMRWWRRWWPTCPKAASRRPPSTCAMPARSACPKPPSRPCSTARRAAFAQHGFTDIVILGDSGNYQAQLKAVADALNRDWKGGPARAHFIADYYQAAQAPYPQAAARARPERRADRQPCRRADTALMLARGRRARVA